MSNADFENLSADKLPVKDASGALSDSPIARSSTSHLIVTEYGAYEEVQISNLVLHGLDISHLDLTRAYCGRLFVQIDVDEGEHVATVILSKRHWTDPEFSETDKIAVVNALWDPPFENPLSFIPDYSEITGVTGSFDLIPGPVSEDTLQILFPLSSIIPLIDQDDACNFSEMSLHGVTQENSDNGVLEWSLSEQEYTYELILINPLTGYPVAMAVIPMGEYAPYTCEITALNESGITGSAVLEGFVPSEGRLVIKVADTIHVHADARVHGDAVVEGNAVVEGSIVVEGNTDLQGDIVLSSLAGEVVTRPLAVDPEGKIVFYDP